MRKKIKGFSHYSIDEKGIVINDLTSKIKTPTLNLTGKGYLYVDLWESGEKYRKYIHRLVAEAFIPNPENKPYINHIDGNPRNNNVNNLEWCTPLENVEHASKVLGVMKAYKNHCEKQKRAVIQINRFTKEKVGKYDSIAEASKKTGVPTSGIVNVLKGRQSYTKDFVWKYCEVEE